MVHDTVLQKFHPVLWLMRQARKAARCQSRLNYEVGLFGPESSQRKAGWEGAKIAENLCCLSPRL